MFSEPRTGRLLMQSAPTPETLYADLQSCILLVMDIRYVFNWPALFLYITFATRTDNGFITPGLGLFRIIWRCTLVHIPQ